MHTKILIIGSGPAGYTSAIYAARAMLSPVIISGFDQGGQLMITTEVENYPGFEKAIQGPDLMEQMRRQAIHCGAQMVSDYVIDVDMSRRPFAVTCDSGAVYTADAMIIATGAQAQWLNVTGEQFYRGYGVSGCAVCDGAFFRNQEIVVVGGGNTAVEEALYLSTFGSRVTLVHRRDSLKAEKVLQKRLLEHPKIKCVWNSVVDEICGQEDPRRVTHVRLKNVNTGETSDLKAAGVFIAIGHRPATDLFDRKLKMKDGGYIWTEPGSTKTSVLGAYACGDVCDSTYRQAITSAGMGCMAALDAERWLATRDIMVDADAA